MAEMIEMANAHMRRDIGGGGKWICSCEACHEIRSLMGLEKMLDVRPLVREVQLMGERLEALADGPEKRILLAQYLKLHDKLAEAVAK
jgi:hypothetical protein